MRFVLAYSFFILMFAPWFKHMESAVVIFPNLVSFGWVPFIAIAFWDADAQGTSSVAAAVGDGLCFFPLFGLAWGLYKIMQGKFRAQLGQNDLFSLDSDFLLGYIVMLVFGFVYFLVVSWQTRDVSLGSRKTLNEEAQEMRELKKSGEDEKDVDITGEMQRAEELLNDPHAISAVGVDKT